MSKSILVIDTPERCLDCPLGNSEESDGEEVWCSILECATYQKGIYEDEEEELYNSKKPDWCPLQEKAENKIITNADRIRNMTDEELTDFLLKCSTQKTAPCMIGESVCKHEDYTMHDKGCKDCFKEWLEGRGEE